MDLLTYTNQEFPADLKCQVLSFLRVVFWEGFTGENRLRDWITAERYHPLHFVLVENGLVVSHTEVVWKYLEHAGQTYKTYGLTGVLTFPSFRHEGHGLQVVRAASDWIAASDADIGMFHCDPALQGFYARCGWIPMAGAVTLTGPRENPNVSSERMMMQFFTEKGRQGQERFERLPVYFDEDDTW